MAQIPERRSSPRIAVELHVEFRHLGRPTETYAEIVRNLSSGGVFIESTVGLALGTQVDLEIAPGPGVRPITLRAEVVRIEEDPGRTGSKVTQRTQGMAMRFLDCDPNELARLKSLAESMVTREGGERS